LKLKVRCQICGKDGEVETAERNQSFYNHKLSDFVEIKDVLDYEIWLCYQCENEFDVFARVSSDNYFQPLIDSLNLRKGEVKNYEWKEMIAEKIVKEVKKC